jgi:hypothetical protein
MVVGNAQLLQKQYATAWETLRSTLDLAIQSGEDRVRGKALLNLGMIALQLNRPDAASYIEQARDWYANHGDVYTALERETVAQDGLMMLSRAAELSGDRQLADNYKKQFTQSINANPDRYSQVRNSPCFALYKAQPSNKQQTQRTQ